MVFVPVLFRFALERRRFFLALDGVPVAVGGGRGLRALGRLHRKCRQVPVEIRAPACGTRGRRTGADERLELATTGTAGEIK